MQYFCYLPSSTWEYTKTQNTRTLESQKHRRRASSTAADAAHGRYGDEASVKKNGREKFTYTEPTTEKNGTISYIRATAQGPAVRFCTVCLHKFSEEAPRTGAAEAPTPPRSGTVSDVRTR